MNTNFKVIGLTRLGIKPESTAPEADILATRPLFGSVTSKLLILFRVYDIIDYMQNLSRNGKRFIMTSQKLVE